MTSKITFYIARHGKTLLNTLRRTQGWSDSPLTNEGIEVAEYLGSGLRDIKFESVYTSDLRRTRQTANIILQNQGQKDLDITELEDLREVCFGSYEGGDVDVMWKDAALYLHYTNGKQMSEDIFDRTKDTTYEHVVDSLSKLDEIQIAENFDEIEKRTQKALKEIANNETKKNQDLNILIVAHGMCINLMLQNLGGKELIKRDIENASVSKVIYQNGKFTVKSIGDMKYVEKGKNIFSEK